MRILIALFFAATINAAAQSPEVPHKMEFAGMTLTIRDDARREIQKDVDALTQSPKHFRIKAERAKTYFPLIEKVFEEEGVPVDFKYLVLQESSLIADAVSTSNAVGFWQFKDFTAIEMGLRVDKEIDERMNIVSATRAAARYIKKNNTFFDNWLYALQAYQMGAGGVMRSLKDTHNGEKHATITSDTYWYVKKFLAHKIAFEEGTKGKGEIEVTVYKSTRKKTLAELSREFAVAEEELKNYNKWTKSGVVPDDRSYVILIPGTSGVSLASLTETMAAPAVTKDASPTAALVIKKINGIRAVEAVQGENASMLAQRAGVELAKFLRWNDISFSTPIVPGSYYLLGRKRARASEDFYTLADGEDLWVVSQKYGVRINKLKKFNRLDHEVLPKGTVLWLSSMKPKSAPSPLATGAVAEVNKEETFGWATEPEKTEVVSISVTAPDSVSNNENSNAGSDIANADSSGVVVVEPVLPANATDTTPSVVIDSPGTEVVTKSPESGKTEHVVQPKETLYAISKIYNVGVMDLVEWNNLDLQQGIKAGQVLKVVNPEVVAKASEPLQEDVFHEVRSSDTLYSIARKYGVTIKDLMEWNDKKDFSVSIGERLKVKGAR